MSFKISVGNIVRKLSKDQKCEVVVIGSRVPGNRLATTIIKCFFICGEDTRIYPL